MNAMTFSKREEVKAWEQEFIPCEHTLCLAPQDPGNAESKGTYSHGELDSIQATYHFYRSKQVLYL